MTTSAKAKKPNSNAKRLAEIRAKHAPMMAKYWAGSVSASVLADYASGNVRNIYVK